MRTDLTQAVPVDKRSWVIRWAAVLSATLVGTFGLSLVGPAPVAGAASISGDQAQISSLESEIATEGAKIEALSNQYDQAQGQEQAIAAQLAAAKAKLVATRAKEAASRSAMEQDAVQSFVNDSSATELTAIFESSTSNYIIRSAFLHSAVGSLSGAVASYQSEQRAVSAASDALKAQQAAMQAKLRQLSSDEAAAQALTNQENTQLANVKGNLQGLLAAAHAAEVAREQAAAAAEAAQLAAQAQQIQPAPASSGGGGSSYSAPTLAPSASWSQQAQVAVQAAMSQVGKPYVWGGASPSVGFDCSGLVMWAWEQAGVDLPHYTVSQYDDTTHISEGQLQPGDIVFYNSPYDGALGHEAMYIGGGQVVQAPTTGMDVMVTSITWAGDPVAFSQP
jgi:cell wall-associated NlpC family hydrolase